MVFHPKEGVDEIIGSLAFPPLISWLIASWGWRLGWVFLTGFPSNLAAIQLLKEYIVSEIGVGDGEIIAMSKGMHLYEYAWELARATTRME